jgi:hypothetical protein
MAETIDFDVIAGRIVELTDVRLIRDQLRQIWNARGTVDIAKIEFELAHTMGDTARGPHIKHIDCALRTLDRPGGGPKVRKLQ